MAMALMTSLLGPMPLNGQSYAGERAMLCLAHQEDSVPTSALNGSNGFKINGIDA